MRRTTSHLLPSGVPAAGYQRDGNERKVACSPLCYVPKVNVPQDRAHGFASLFFPLTLHPAAVQRTGNASRLHTSVSLTFYPIMDSAAEVSEYPPASPLTIVPRMGCHHAYWNSYTSRLPATIVPPAGSQRSGRGDHASHPPHEVHRLSPPSPAHPTRGSRHRPAWVHHPQA